MSRTELYPVCFDLQRRSFHVHPPFGFEKEYNIRFYDCDYNGNVKIAAVLRALADIAELDYDARGYGHELLWKQGMVFLLSGESIRFHRRPRGNETLTYVTWERGTKGARFYRSFEAYDPSGALVLSADSEGLLANPKPGASCRPDSGHFEMDLASGSDARRPPGWNGLARKAATHHLMERPVRFSDLDNNRHVYNAVYAEMTLDALPFAGRSRGNSGFPHQLYFRSAARGRPQPLGM